MCGAWRDGAAAHGVMFDDEPSGSRGAFGAVGTGRSTGVRPWQDIAAVRSRAVNRGIFFASCVPEGTSGRKSAGSWQHFAAVYPK